VSRYERWTVVELTVQLAIKYARKHDPHGVAGWAVVVVVAVGGGEHASRMPILHLRDPSLD